MADRYALQQVGVADGTVNPKLKADGRQVGAVARKTLASKVTGVAWAVNDRIYLGKVPAGAILTDVEVNTDTSFGTSTLDVGDGTTADKYVDGKTNTVTNAWVSLGIKPSVLDDGVLEEHTDIWLTVLTDAIASGTVATFRLTYLAA